MKTFTIADIRNARPCYDPVTGMDAENVVVHKNGFLPENWTGTAVDIMRIDGCPLRDRLWVLRHCADVDCKIWRAFALAVAKDVLHLWNAPDVVVKFLNGDSSLALAAADAAAFAANAAYVAYYAAANAAARADTEKRYAAIMIDLLSHTPVFTPVPLTEAQALPLEV